MSYVSVNRLICDKMVNTWKRRPKLASQLEIGKVKVDRATPRLYRLTATETEAQCNRLKLAYEFETGWYPAAKLFAHEV